MNKKRDTLVFQFGENWQKFIQDLSDEKIVKAQKSLLTMLNRDNLQGVKFLDAGCGSGLFSLAALELGASEVVSFDADTQSVACANHLRYKYNFSDKWHIYHGSVLDQEWVDSLGKFDIVYSWGVLHHTGNMWQAFKNIMLPVADSGSLFISIYNDQGVISNIWLLVKKLYNISPSPVRFLIAACYFVIEVAVKVSVELIHLRPPGKWFKTSRERGMNLWHDAVDWVGGYPFETASAEEVIVFFKKSGFNIIRTRLKKGSGCNEFVFDKDNNSTLSSN